MWSNVIAAHPCAVTTHILRFGYVATLPRVTSGESALPDAKRRVLQMAQNKLRSLEIPTYVNREHILFGRIRVELESHARVTGLTAIDALHTFAVLGHDRLCFIPPSPARFCGPINFFDVVRTDDLATRVTAHWRALMERTSAALVRAQQYYPNARLDPETWTLGTVIKTAGGESKLRIQIRDKRVGIQLASLDGSPWDAASLGTFSIWLDEDPILHDAAITDQFLAEARKKRRDARAAENESTEIDLRKFGLEELQSDAFKETLPPLKPEPPARPPRPQRPATQTLQPFATASHDIEMPTGPLPPLESPTLERPPLERPTLPLPLISHLASAPTRAEGMRGEAVTETSVPGVEPLVDLVAELSPEESSDVILQLGTQDFVNDATAAPAVVRLPRLRVASLMANISLGQQLQSQVPIVDITLEGLFLSISTDELPPVGLELRVLSPTGHSVSGRVVHTRNASEGTLLKTGSGAGVQLNIGSALARRRATEHLESTPTRQCWLIMVDGDLERASALASLARSGAHTILVALDVLEAVCFLHEVHVNALLIGRTFTGVSCEEITESLATARHNIEIVVRE